MPAIDIPFSVAFEDYDALVAAIGDWLNRSDLTGSAQVMIALAESRLRRELAPLFEEATDSVVAVDGLANLPADMGTLRRVSYNGASLPQIGITQGYDIAPGSTPLAYTIEADQLRLWPETDATVDILYHTRLVPLSSNNPSNALFERHPDLYFYGALMFAEGYVANDERAALFKSLWDEGIAEAQVYLTRQHFSGQLVPRGMWRP